MVRPQTPSHSSILKRPYQHPSLGVERIGRVPEQGAGFGVCGHGNVVLVPLEGGGWGAICLQAGQDRFVANDDREGHVGLRFGWWHCRRKRGSYTYKVWQKQTGVRIDGSQDLAWRFKVGEPCLGAKASPRFRNSAGIPLDSTYLQCTQDGTS